MKWAAGSGQQQGGKEEAAAAGLTGLLTAQVERRLLWKSYYCRANTVEKLL